MDCLSIGIATDVRYQCMLFIKTKLASYDVWSWIRQLKAKLKIICGKQKTLASYLAQRH